MSLVQLKHNRPVSWILLYAIFLQTAAIPVYSQTTTAALLAQGIVQYENAEFESAILTLQSAIQKGLTAKDDIIQARKYLAFAYTAMGEDEKAKKEYLTLLEQYPIFDLLLSESPKLRVPFEEAKKEFDAMDRKAPDVETVFPDTVDENSALRLSAVITDESEIEPISFYYKSPKSARYDRIGMQKEFGNTYFVLVPADQVTIEGLEVYVEVKDRKGNGPGRSGSAASPLKIAVRMVDRTPPLIQHIPVINAPEKKDLAVSADITDRSGVSGASVYYRVKGEIQYLKTEMRWIQGSQFTGNIPAGSVTDAGLEYFIHVSDRAGNPPATSGSAAVPNSVEVYFIDKEPPEIEHEEIATALDNKNIPILATVTDRGGVAEVILFYRKPAEKNYLEIAMRPTGMVQYAAEIPSTEVTGNGIQYYIQAKDRTGNPPSIAGSAVKPFTIKVSRFDQEPPRLAHMGVADAVQKKPVQLKVMVIDNVGVKEVLAHHRKVGEKGYQSVTMSRNENDLFLTQIEADTTDIEYYLEASDVSGNPPSFWQNVDKPQRINVHPDLARPGLLAARRKGTSKWVYVGIAVAAVGGSVLGLSLSSGGNGGSGPVKTPLPVPPGAP